MKNPAVSSAPPRMCPKASSALGLASSAPASARTSRPFSVRCPTGLLRKPLETRIQYADTQAVSATTQIVVRWTHRLNRCHPKIHSPRNVDSTKNATIVSTASEAPKTLPA